RASGEHAWENLYSSGASCRLSTVSDMSERTSSSFCPPGGHQPLIPTISSTRARKTYRLGMSDALTLDHANHFPSLPIAMVPFLISTDLICSQLRVWSPLLTPALLTTSGPKATCLPALNCSTARGSWRPVTCS